jgi:nitrate/nitrite transporter NarK
LNITRINAFSVNHLDIAPQHAGVLMGLSNMAGTLPGIISPLVTGFIVQNKVWYNGTCTVISLLPCCMTLYQLLKLR